jgi:hypothetical protein
MRVIESDNTVPAAQTSFVVGASKVAASGAGINKSGGMTQEKTAPATKRMEIYFLIV